MLPQNLRLELACGPPVPVSAGKRNACMLVFTIVLAIHNNCYKASPSACLQIHGEFSYPEDWNLPRSGRDTMVRETNYKNKFSLIRGTIKEKLKRYSLLGTRQCGGG